MPILLSIHAIANIRGDGLLPELVASLERPIPRVAEPVDALPVQLIGVKRLLADIS